MMSGTAQDHLAALAKSGHKGLEQASRVVQILGSFFLRESTSPLTAIRGMAKMVAKRI